MSPSTDTPAGPDGMAPADPEPGLDERLQLEAGTIRWSELVRHFARGVVLRLDGTTDLVEVAGALVRDDAATLETWLADGSVRRASDDDARDWVAREPEFRCVVAAPWVLVQELH